MPDEILIRFSVKDDGSPVIEKVNQKLKETTKASKSLVPGMENAAQSLAGFASENAALIGTLVAVGAAIKSVIDEGIKYAMTVDEMARAGGTSAEEASRMIQVLDDYEISAQDAMAATRALTNNGLAPNIETLAKLSDQYIALNTVEEKNKFIIDNLGRGGLQWAKALEQGSAALREQAAAVDKSLILTQKQVQEAEAARLALDNWNDSIQAVKTSLAMDALPWLTKFVNMATRYGEISRENRTNTDLLIPGLAALRNVIMTVVDATRENEDVTEAAAETNIDYAKSAKEIEEAEKAAKEAAKALSDEISSRISLINNIQSAEESYTEKSASLTEKRQLAEQELSKFRAQGYWEQSDQIQGALSDIEEIKKAEADLAKEREKQTLQFIAQLVAEERARDGWQEGEFEAFSQQMLNWGLWSQSAVDQANKVMSAADSVNAKLDAMQTEKTVTINVVETYSAMSGPNYNPYASQSGKKSHAGGGSFMLPFGGGNESFVLPGGNTASPGETVTIDKAGSVSRTDELLEKLLRKETINEGRFVRKMLAAMQQGQGQ